MQILNRLFLLLIVVISANTAYGLEVRRLHFFQRSTAMGGAFTAVADGQETIVYNPAGLLIENVDWSLSFPLFWIAYNDLTKNLSNGLDDLDYGDEKSLNKVPGERAYLDVQLGFPFWFHPNSGNFVGISGEFWLEIVAPIQTIIPMIHLEIVEQYVGEYGTAWELWDSGFFIGATAKVIKRSGVFTDMSLIKYNALVTDNIAESYQNLKDEYGSETPPVKFSLDFGMLYRFDLSRWNPRIGLSILDVMGVDFDELGQMKQLNSLGFAISNSWEEVHVTCSVDYQDFTYDYFSDGSLRRRLNVGFEAAVKKTPDNSRVFAIQLGLRELHYISYGFIVRLGVFETSYVRWVENYGTENHSELDTRYMMTLSLVF